MMFDNKKIFPEVIKYSNGNLGIVLHECELIPDDEGFVDPSPLTVLSVNIPELVRPKHIWIRDDEDSHNYAIVKELLNQNVIAYTGNIKPSGYIYLKEVELRPDFFTDLNYVQTHKE